MSSGSVFETSSKKVEYAPQGLLAVSRWRRLIAPDTPFMAIGGISREIAPDVLRAGADSIAVISALTKSPDGHELGDATKGWLELWADGGSRVE